MNTYITKLNTLIAFSILYSVLSATKAYYGTWDPEDSRTDLFYSFSMIFLIAWWVKDDMHHQRFYGPYEFPAFVYFGMPLVLPYYLIKTRGWRGLVSTAGFFALFIMPYFLAQIIYFIKWVE